jgi:hypothetical protein
MKKVILSITGVSLSLLAFAQEKTDSASVILKTDLSQRITEPINQTPGKEIIAPVIIVSLLIFLIVSVTKYILEYRLKSKIVNKGISEQLTSALFNNNGVTKKDEAMKWAILLCGIAIGMTITYYTMPLHLHSLAIIAFSIGVSYLVYFFYLKNRKG